MTRAAIAALAVFSFFWFSAPSHSIDPPGTCFDLNNCGDDFAPPSSQDVYDYLNFLRQEFGAGFDDGGMCFDATCNLSRQECREYCDEVHDDLHRGCGYLPTAMERAICRAEAMEVYAQCIRRCP